jgi:NTE family protein
MVARRSPNTVLAVAALGVFMAFVDATVVNIAFPQIARDFHGAGIASLQWVVNGYNIVFAAFLVTSGRLADLLGRRRMFLIGLTVFTAASGLCALAPTVETLVATRLVQALGASMIVPASLALVLDGFDKERHGHAVAMWAAIAALAAGIGPSLGGLLVTTASWRLVFLINIPIGIVAAILARRLLRESRSPQARRSPDVVGAALLAAAIGALVLAIVQGGTWGWTSPGVLGAASAGVTLAVVFVRRCLERPDPLVDLRMFANRACGAANAATVSGSAGFFGFTLVNVLFMTGVWHYSVLRAGLAVTPSALIVAVVAPSSSKLVARFGPRAVAAGGSLIWASAPVWLATRAGVHPDYVGEWLPGLMLAGIGGGLAFPTLSGAAVTSAAGQDFATASAVNSVARQMGAALGVALVVAALGTPATLGEAMASFDHAWTLAAVLLGLASALSLGIARPATRAAPDRGDYAAASSPLISMKRRTEAS